MSRYAYPASQSFADVSWHGALRDLNEMEAIIAQEEKEERASLWVCVVTRAQEKTHGESSSGLPESAPGALPGYPVPDPAVNNEDANLVAPERPVGQGEGVLGAREVQPPRVEPPLVARGGAAKTLQFLCPHRKTPRRDSTQSTKSRRAGRTKSRRAGRTKSRREGRANCRRAGRADGGCPTAGFSASVSGRDGTTLTGRAHAGLKRGEGPLLKRAQLTISVRAAR